MEIFNAWKLSSVLFRIESARRDGIKFHIDQGSRDDEVPKKFIDDWVAPLLDDARELAASAELPSTDARVNPTGGFSIALENGVTYQELDHELKVLRESIQFDLSDKHIYIVDTEKQKYNSTDSFLEMWGRAGFYFPSIRKETMAAMRAYVYGLNTACVFHLMRTTEIGLRALARRLQVSLPKNKAVEWAQWQEVITSMNKRVDTLASGHRAGKKKDELLEFYRGSIGEFLGFKDAYRNHVMHMRDKGTYDEREARSLIGGVSHFMTRLSHKIDEKGLVLTQARIDRMLAKIDAERKAETEKQQAEENEKRQAEETVKSGVPEAGDVTATNSQATQ